MSLFWMQSVMVFLFFTVWCLIGQVVMDQRRSQRRIAAYGAKNV